MKSRDKRWLRDACVLPVFVVGCHVLGVTDSGKITVVLVNRSYLDACWVKMVVGMEAVFYLIVVGKEVDWVVETVARLVPPWHRAGLTTGMASVVAITAVELD